MKNIRKLLAIILSATLLLACVPFSASAATYSGQCGENVTWSLDTETGVLTISGEGWMNDYDNSSPPWYNDRSYIKSVKIGDGVTRISYSAFSYCSNLESVTIPDSVTIIGGSAFSYCSSLESVTIPDSVTFIGTDVFYNTAIYNNSNNWVNNVLYIGNHLIEAKANISGSYIIKDGTKTIASSAFSGCSSLTSVTILDSVTSIGDYAFRECSSLTSVTIPDSVTYIGDSAFDFCISLTSVTIPDSVTRIARYAFFGCSSLASVTIPDSVTGISYDVFYGTAIYRNDDNWVDNVLYIGNHLIKAKANISGSYIIKNGTKTIADYAFNNCGSLVSVTIDDSVISIGDYAFYGCSSLTSVTIPDSVTSIGGSAFENCSSLTSVTISDSVTSIGRYAFENCSSLTSVTIGNSVTSIGTYAFSGCSSLTGVNITDLASWCKISFSGDYSNPLYNAHNLYLNGELVTDLVIPDSVTSINDLAFYSCSSLKSVTIPDSVTYVGNYAFENCSILTSVTIPDSVTSIGFRAFYNTAIYNDNNNWVDDVLYIGNHLIDAKYNISGNYIIKDGTKTIVDFAFDYCRNLTSVTIPDSVISIGRYAFFICSSLTSVTIPDSVTSIGDSAFYYCSNLTSVTIPDSVTSIGDRAIASETVIYGYANSTAQKYAEENGNQFIALHEHSYTSSVTLPTCTEPGYTTYTCACGDSYTETISPLSHSDEALTGYCERCGEYLITPSDLNGDGVINTADRMILSRSIAKWGGYEEYFVYGASGDLNGDGVVNTADRMIISRYLAKWAGYDAYFA